MGSPLNQLPFLVSLFLSGYRKNYYCYYYYTVYMYVIYYRIIILRVILAWNQHYDWLLSTLAPSPVLPSLISHQTSLLSIQTLTLCPLFLGDTWLLSQLSLPGLSPGTLNPVKANFPSPSFRNALPYPPQPFPIPPLALRYLQVNLTNLHKLFSRSKNL